LLATATEQAELNVEGMHCATCPVTVNTGAAGVSGVTAVRVSMDEAKAWVSYDPARTSPDAIAAAITGSGYPATPVPAQ
jgi:copper chaperone CopZ